VILLAARLALEGFQELAPGDVGEVLSVNGKIGPHLVFLLLILNVSRELRPAAQSAQRRLSAKC